jgi:hypothetical protein
MLFPAIVIFPLDHTNTLLSGDFEHAAKSITQQAKANWLILCM